MGQQAVYQTPPSPAPNSLEALIVKLTNVMSEQFDLKPKNQRVTYQRPYPDWMEYAPVPNRNKLPEFPKFSGQDNVSTMEHISKYMVQLGEASAHEALKV